MSTSIIFLVSILLSACSTTESKPAPTPEQLATEKGYTLSEPVDRIMNYRLDGWNYINSKALIIHSGPSQSYLVTLQIRCPELSSREVIATTSTGTSMQARFDAIIVRQTGGTPQKCYIDEIYKLEKNKKKTTKNNALHLPANYRQSTL
ncbi:DUF6491 family protein [Oceanicoccus sp. KOV_DT_Chl]|uniref:DUF6491 family protein n=1 Tax=Oceanicoccus sp. KOV_DT_Chl TaxID=1904639 RepID=UPI0011AF9DB3|nr:DUF6491 family protein [Oceanicoccus sp. KOV_DT_Chl]